MTGLSPRPRGPERAVEIGCLGYTAFCQFATNSLKATIGDATLFAYGCAHELAIVPLGPFAAFALSLVRYAAADGRVLDEVPSSTGLFRAWLAHVRALPGGHAILQRKPYEGSDHRPVTLLRAVGGDTVKLFTRDLRLSSTATYPSCGMALSLPVPFAAQIRWDVRGDAVVASTGAEYVVDVFGARGLERSIRRDVRPRPVTREEALRSK